MEELLVWNERTEIILYILKNADKQSQNNNHITMSAGQSRMDVDPNQTLERDKEITKLMTITDIIILELGTQQVAKIKT